MAYLSVRGNVPGPLFLLVNGQPLSRATLTNWLRQIFSTAGIEGNFSSHTKREGGREGWEKPKHKLARKQKAIATTLCEELQASNCVYKSRGAPARGIGPPLL